MAATEQATVVIPARYGSTRFPGKPLHSVAGKMMIERVWRIACEAVGCANVYIATDDQRIQSAAESFSAQVVMTSEQCENGSERVCEALAQLKRNTDVVVNLQGDAPLTPPWFICALVDQMRADARCEFATPAVQISRAQYQQILESKKHNPFSGTFVTFDRNKNALYFSKQVIPALRKTDSDLLPLYQHIGIYAYRPEALKRYVALEAGVLERTEGLEQLRILENGDRIKIVTVDFKGRSTWAIDAPGDVAIVEEIIAREGELVNI